MGKIGYVLIGTLGALVVLHSLMTYKGSDPIVTFAAFAVGFSVGMYMASTIRAEF